MQANVCGNQPVSAQDDETVRFAAKVLTTTEAVWTQIFEEQVGQPYKAPRKVVFSGVTQSACGGASGATGPFYCPVDQRASLDTQFFEQLDQQMGAGGAGVDGAGDLGEALNAARKIGDDHLQRSAGRVPQPHTFTHGTSEQRSRWFERGYDSGLIRDCDTFAARQL